MSYTPAQVATLFKKVTDRLQNGESLRVILSDKGTPSRTAFYRWLEKDEKLQERFARACEIGDEVLFEETLEIARSPIQGTTTTIDHLGVKVVTGDMLGHRKLLIETIDKVLARRNPRKYGNRIDVTSGDKAIALPAIVGMVIKNEIPTDETSGYADLL